MLAHKNDCCIAGTYDFISRITAAPRMRYFDISPLMGSADSDRHFAALEIRGEGLRVDTHFGRAPVLCLRLQPLGFIPGFSSRDLFERLAEKIAGADERVFF